MAGETATPAGLRMPPPFARTSLPGRIVFSDGALSRLPDELDQQNLRQAMLITASNQAQLGRSGHQALGDRIALHWEEVRQHVPRGLAQRATSAAKAADADVLVTIGGGSTTGLGKAVAVETGLPLVVVPTTYAGSEMTPIYGLTSDNDKTTARDPRALPKIVIYDPSLLTTLPAAVVGPSGMNALAHCAEALWAAGHDPVTDAIALDGAGRLQQHLLAACVTGHPAARGEVLIAACLAGTALGTVGTSLHHALCHLLGGMFDAPHAETHAIMLPYLVGYLQPAVPDAARRLAQSLGTRESGLATAIWELGASVGTPEGLRSIGIGEDHLGRLVDAAVAKRLASPRPLDCDSLYGAVHAAWAGQPPHGEPDGG
jgi:maleylacetate reductase